MLSNYFFLFGTLLLSLNIFRPFGLAISDWLYFSALILMVLETLTIDKGNAKVWINKYFYIPVWLILFGEMTFIPGAGYGKNRPIVWNTKLGMYLNLPTKTR